MRQATIPGSDIITRLREEVYAMQSFRKQGIAPIIDTGLDALEKSFHAGVFPVGAVHEFISYEQEEAAATNGFMCGLLDKLMSGSGPCVWISKNKDVFPPALKIYGIDPGRVVFINISKPKEALWTIEEALKCESLSAVVGEVPELDFNQSRRLQLAVEASHVTGFIHRYKPRSENPVACITRWKIKPIISDAEDGMPGVGLARWHVRLQKVRNGKPGNWDMEWSPSGFRIVTRKLFTISETQTLKAG